MRKRILVLYFILGWLTIASLGRAEILPTEGLSDYQVLQRSNENTATLSFVGTTENIIPGKIETRICKEWLGEVVQDWTKTGTCNQGQFEATLQSVPVGGPYRIDIRMATDTSQSEVETGTIHNILVGDLWILAGQSNMQGYGVMKDVESPSLQVYMFGMDDRWQVAETPTHRLYEAKDGVYHNPIQDGHEQMRRQRHKGAGLELAFAKEMVRRTGIPIGLIPCAHGGTSMDQWSPELRDKEGNSLYGATLRRCKAAGGKIKGFLWHQGEAESSPQGAKLFQEKFTHLVESFRQDFGQPNLPFYYVQIGRYISPDNIDWNRVQDAQRQMETLIPPPFGMAVSIDLALDDAIHVGTQGLKRLGIRLANLAIRDLFNDPSIQSGPRPVSASVEPSIWKRIRVKFDHINGNLVSEGRLNGFSIRKSTGEPILCIYDQYIDPVHPTEVILEIQVDWGENLLPEDAVLWYGFGNDPYCNLRDERDMACPVFGPIPIQNR